MKSKKPFYFAFLFAVYHFLVHFLLGVHEFYESIFPAFVLLIFQTVLVFICQLSIQLILKKLQNNNTILKSATYLFSSLVVSLLFFLIFTIYKEYYLSYFAAFLITGMVYSLFDFSVQFFTSLSQNNSIISLDSKTEANKTDGSKMFSLTDSRGKNRLSIQLQSIICFEANDNYVTIYYEDASENLVKKLERISMKRIEEFLGEENNDFLRIHKSYIINTKFIIQVLGKAQAQKVRLKHLNEELPVSRKINISDYTA
jgi:hypothetical protein